MINTAKHRWFRKLPFWTAAAYALLTTCILLSLSDHGDAEEVTAGWLVFAAPWIWTGLLGSHSWLAVPLNATSLYIVMVLIANSRQPSC